MSLNVSKHVESIFKLLEEKEEVREKAIKCLRDVLRLARDAIFDIHRGLLNEAESKISKAIVMARKIVGEVSKFPDLANSGTIGSVVQEVVEAQTLLYIVKYGKVPEYSPDIVPNPAYYLNGLADAIGELKRRVLDLIRHNKIAEAERMFAYMEEIYLAISKCLLSDSITPGLKHKCDVARRILESVREVLTYAYIVRGRGR